MTESLPEYNAHVVCINGVLATFCTVTAAISIVVLLVIVSCRTHLNIEHPINQDEIKKCI